MNEFKHYIKEINWLNADMKGKDFLLTWEKSLSDLEQTLYTAEALQYLHKNNIAADCFSTGLAVSIFRDKSTRTRFSFASAADMLGLMVQALDEEKSQIAHGETVRETANMISFLTDIIGIRDDMYLGAGNAYMREVAAALDEGHREGLLHQRPGIINLQCDMDHPTQTLADLLHLKRHFGSLEKLKGKKIAMTWAYSPSYGKPLSVPQGIIALMTRFGMEVTLAHPEGYDLLPEVMDIAKKNSEKSQGSFSVAGSMEEAFTGADIVYPKSWAPYQVMEQRTGLLKQKDLAGLEALEKHCLKNNAAFENWECDEKKMALTRDSEALYMHCLPADISGISCIKGEVTAAVFEKYRLSTYKEAGFKPFIIAAMMLNNRFARPGEILESLYKRKELRVGF